MRRIERKGKAKETENYIVVYVIDANIIVELSCLGRLLDVY